MPVADTVLLLVTLGVFLGSVLTGLAAAVAISALIRLDRAPPASSPGV